MLNRLFAGILAQYGMSDGQVETAEVESAGVENAEVESAEVETAEVESPDDVEADMGWKEKDDYTEFVLLRVHNVPFEGVYGCNSVDDVKKWIAEHTKEFNAMWLEPVLLAEDEDILRELAYMLAFDCHEPITKRTDYLGACYYVASEFELEYYKGLDNYDLKKGVILHVYYAHTDGSRYFFGRR